MLGVGTVIGFTASIAKDFINNYINKKEKEKNLTLKHLDEIFVLLYKYSMTARKTLLNLKNTHSTKKEFDDTGARLGFLIRVYFPCIHEEYKSLLKSSSDYILYQIEVSQENVMLNKNKLSALSQSFETKYANLCTSIIEKAKEYK